MSTTTPPLDRDHPGSVLIVEQDPAVRDSCRQTLEEAGYTVLVAADETAALDTLHRAAPDVIVLGAAGGRDEILAWAQCRRADPAASDVPLILLGPTDYKRQPEHQAPADEILARPIRPRELLMRVCSMVKLRRHRLEISSGRSLHGEQTRMWGVLLDFSRAVTRITDLEALLAKIVDTAAEMTCSRRVSLMLPDETQQYLKIVKAMGFDEGVVPSVRLPLGEAIAGLAFTSGRPVTTLESQPPSQRREGYTFDSFVSMPMMYTTLSMVHQRVGVLNISNRYIDRPFEEWELEFIDLLGSIAGSAIDDIHSRRTRESLLKFERDLQVARMIQQSTFPDRLPEINGFDIFALSEPAAETGGDTYDVLGLRGMDPGGPILDTHDADRAVLLLADATGHGIGPALSVTQVRAMLRMAVRTGMAPAMMARQLNEQLCADLPRGRFITAWLGELNSSDGTLRSFSAGQAPLFRYDAADGAVEILRADTMPLGICRDMEISISDPVVMQPGDAFAIISDGILEARNPTGGLFGVDRAVQVIRANHRRSAEQVYAALRSALVHFTQGVTATDDRTAIIIKRVMDDP